MQRNFYLFIVTFNVVEPILIMNLVIFKQSHEEVH